MEEAAEMSARGRRPPHFLHVFTSNSNSHQLKIPVKFIRHMEGRTSGWVLLLGPSGNVWHVELTQLDGDLFFDQGWPAFVRDHLLESGDFLVFRYDGNWHFTVQIFDQSACEKEAAFHSKSSQEGKMFDGHTGQKRVRDEMTDFWDKLSEAVTKKARNTSSECHSECVDNSQETDAGISAMLSQTDAYNVKRAIQRSHKEDGSNLYNGGCLSTLTDLEEKRLAETFTSSFPYFMRTMKRFNVSGSYTLNVPYKFSTEHLPNCKTEIVLRNVNGACWMVNSVPTIRVHTSHTFCGGWLAFVRSNGIRTGDICIFELVHNCELLVHIFRVGKEEPENEGGGGACNGLAILSNATSRKVLEGLAKKSIKTSSKVHSRSLKNVYMCDKRGCKAPEKQKHGNSKKNPAKISGCGNEKPESGIGSLRFMIALDEQKAARSFTSGFPNFVRIMRKFNISGSYTLKIPHQFSLVHLPNSKTEIVLFNLRGESWTVNSVPDSKGRMVHTFCGGWMAFVRDNDIQMGDICIFELTSKCEMRVHISRFGKKGMDNPLGKSDDEISIELASGSHLNF